MRQEHILTSNVSDPVWQKSFCLSPQFPLGLCRKICQRANETGVSNKRLNALEINSISTQQETIKDQLSTSSGYSAGFRYTLTY